MMTKNVERMLKKLLMLGMTSSLLIGCGEGFRAAKVGAGLPVNTVLSHEETTNKINENIPSADAYRAPDERSVQQQILEKKAAEDAAKKAAELANKPDPTDPNFPELAQLKQKNEPAKSEDEKKSDPLKLNIVNGTNFEEVTADMAKDAAGVAKPELAEYLEGLTVSVRSAGDKKLSVEVLAVIKRGDAKQDRIVAEGMVDVVSKKNSLLPTSILLMPSQASMYSADDMYRPAKNTNVGAICADEKCETLYVLVRSQGKLKKQPTLFDLVLELKRHDRGYEVVRSNASDKSLSIKSFHEAE